MNYLLGPKWLIIEGIKFSKISKYQSHKVGDHPPITPMRAATRDEIPKSNEWRIYDYVTRHFIASLHDDMEYSEKTLIADVNGFHFKYTWHEVFNILLFRHPPNLSQGIYRGNPFADIFLRYISPI